MADVDTQERIWARDAALLTDATWLAGDLAWHESDLPAARAALERSLSLAQDDERARSRATNSLAVVSFGEGDLAQARTLFEQSLEMRRASGDAGWIAEGMHNLGIVLVESGDTDGASALYAEALEMEKRAGNTRAVAATLTSLGYVAERGGDNVRARELYAEALTMRRDIGVVPDVVDSLISLADVADDPATARAHLSEALTLATEAGDAARIAEVREKLSL